MSVYMRTEDLAPANISAANVSKKMFVVQVLMWAKVSDANAAAEDDDDWDTDVDAVCFMY